MRSTSEISLSRRAVLGSLLMLADL